MTNANENEIIENEDSKNILKNSVSDKNNEQNILTTLVELAKIDCSLARIRVDKKQIEEELRNLHSALQQAKKAALEKETELKTQKQKCKKEENLLKEENDKLVARRKALGTLGNKKSIEKAQQEISFASKQLEGKEELILVDLENAEALDKELNKLLADIKVKEEELKKKAQDGRESFKAFDTIEEEKLKVREELWLALKNQQQSKKYKGKDDVLATYQKIVERYPFDPVCEVKNSTCGSCFVQVVPQLMVEIAKGEKIVRCRACGRILYTS